MHAHGRGRRRPLYRLGPNGGFVARPARRWGEWRRLQQAAGVAAAAAARTGAVCRHLPHRHPLFRTARLVAPVVALRSPVVAVPPAKRAWRCSRRCDVAGVGGGSGWGGEGGGGEGGGGDDACSSQGGGAAAAGPAGGRRRGAAVAVAAGKACWVAVGELCEYRGARGAGGGTAGKGAGDTVRGTRPRDGCHQWDAALEAGAGRWSPTRRSPQQGGFHAGRWWRGGLRGRRGRGGKGGGRGMEDVKAGRRGMGTAPARVAIRLLPRSHVPSLLAGHALSVEPHGWPRPGPSGDGR